MKLLKALVVFFVLLSCSSLQAQTFGVRAGLNYSTFNGPTLPGESFGFSNGFHFGLNYSFDFTDVFSLRTELLYVQKGTKYNYEGPGYYAIHQVTPSVFEYGDYEYFLNISNAYISIPIVANIRLNRKWEVFGGAYVDILVGPTGRGNVRFESIDNPLDVVFRQSLDHNYSSSAITQILGQYLGGINDIGIFVGDEEVTLPRFAGAHSQLGYRAGTLINSFDFGLTAGAHYFLNRGFFIGAQASYGFPDLTDNNVDYRLQELNEEGTFQFSDDKDSHLGFEVSFGFRF